ncbi:MAG TPA: NAD(P)-dependent oxidoreductase [Armatimonadota bacterium]|nr:NAD(P)-dependent oxidoreductase [Armatimonadota bacterium]
MRLLVIGGSGYVGGLVLPILAQHHNIRVFDRRPPAPEVIESSAKNPMEFEEGDVTDPEALSRAVQEMESMLYMAMGRVEDHAFNAPAAFDVNVKGLYLALHAAHHAGVTHAVYTSSMSVYEGDLTTRRFPDEDIPPDSRHIYGFTKRLGEEVCRNAARQWGMSVNALRLCLPTSEDRWLAKTRPGVPTIATTAGDVARALLAALEFRAGFQAFMISGDYEQKFMNLSKAKRLLGWAPLARPSRCTIGNRSEKGDNE